jgi:ADP-heptose:LPS heptosyltransferase
MRRIDRFVGVPFCWASGLAAMVFRRSAPASVDSILVIKFFGLGSILLAAPALRRMRLQFPNARIVFLTFSANAEIVDELPFLDERWFVDPSSLGSFVRSFSMLLARLIRTKIDVVVDLEFFSKFSTFVGSVARPAKHIGFALPTRWRSWNITDAVPLRSDRHVSETFLSTLSPLGIGSEEPLVPRIHFENSTSPSFLPIENMALTREIICVNPNAGVTSLERRWDGDRFAQVIDIMRSENPTALFCLIGSATERKYVDGVRQAIPNNVHDTLNLAGLLTLREIIQLFSLSRLLITNDSGPMHVAAAVGLPTVALFGPESPDFYGPLGNRTINLYAGLRCSPCLNVYDAKVFKCLIGGQCMKEISVGQVVEASRFLLEELNQHRDLVEVLH